MRHIKVKWIMATPGKQQGAALIEVMISVLLLAIAVLALVSLQAAMNKNVTQTKLRGEASFLANQLLGQMWVDQSNLGSYVATATGCTTDSYTNCTNWYAAVQQRLPAGQAEVNVNGDLVGITLRWTVPGEDAARYDMDAVITDEEI